MIAAWTAYTATATGLQDPQAAGIAAANLLTGRTRLEALLGLVDPDLVEDRAIVDLVEGLAESFAAAGNLS
ncbi:mannitol dehydrogenase [Arthrobacter sp. Hiyo1]|nr:mannitol dehydrogenase [Arthrobacter sp. Hiyo1]